MSSLPFHLWAAAVLKSGSYLKEIEFNVLNLVPSPHISISQNNHAIWLDGRRLLREEAHPGTAGLLQGRPKASTKHLQPVQCMHGTFTLVRNHLVFTSFFSWHLLHTDF